MQPLFKSDENFPGIARRNWWDTKPKIGEQDYEGFYEVERAYVLDKATRHCMSLCTNPGDGEYHWDNARGWSIKQNGAQRDVSEKEFVGALRSSNDEMVKAKWMDGFWCVKE